MLERVTGFSNHIDWIKHRKQNSDNIVSFEKRLNNETGVEYYKHLDTGTTILAKNKERVTDTLTGASFYRDSSTKQTFMSWESKYKIYQFFASNPNPLAANNHKLYLEGRYQNFGNFSIILGNSENITAWCNIKNELIAIIPVNDNATLDLGEIKELLLKRLQDHGEILSPSILYEIECLISNLPKMLPWLGRPAQL